MSSVFFSLFFLPALSSAYSWRLNSAPQQCGNLSISIVGSDGLPPYRVLIHPLGPSPLQKGVDPREIIEQTFLGDGPLNFRLNYPAGSQFVAVVSDVTRFGSGGTSGPLTVTGSPNSSCFSSKTSAPSPLFFFNVDQALDSIVQCSPSRIWWDKKAAKGRTNFLGVIPGGQPFVIPQSKITDDTRGTGFSWTPNVPAGTTLIIIGGDIRGSSTAGSGTFKVGKNPRNDSKCLDAASFNTTPASSAGRSLSTRILKPTAPVLGDQKLTNTNTVLTSSINPPDPTSIPDPMDAPVRTGNLDSTDTPEPTDIPDPTSSLSSSRASNSHKAGVIAGVTVTGIAAALSITLLLFFLWRCQLRQHRQQKQRGERPVIDEMGGSPRWAYLNGGNDIEQQRLVSFTISNPRLPFTFDEATLDRPMSEYSRSVASSSVPDVHTPLMGESSSMGGARRKRHFTASSLRSVTVIQHDDAEHLHTENLEHPMAGYSQSVASSTVTDVHTPLTGESSSMGGARKKGHFTASSLRSVAVIQHDDGGPVEQLNEEVETVEIPPPYAILPRQHSHFTGQ